MPGFNEISPFSLMRLIGTTDCPTLIDVRLPEDLAEDPVLLPTSRCVPHTEVATMDVQASDTCFVVICQKGKKLSHGAAAHLRQRGLKAEVLEGGIKSWLTADLPAVPLSTLNRVTDSWVTKHRPKIDRIACPWLIHRFVNPKAQFLFVPPAEVQDVAARFDATPFDMPDGDWTHRGELCTFDIMIERFGLAHGPLLRMAEVIRAADTNRHDLASQAAGLLAISAGYSRLYKDDHRQMIAMFPLYDALYRWARDAFEETHDWPSAAGQ